MSTECPVETGDESPAKLLRSPKEYSVNALIALGNAFINYRINRPGETEVTDPKLLQYVGIYFLNLMQNIPINVANSLIQSLCHAKKTPSIHGYILRYNTKLKSYIDQFRHEMAHYSSILTTPDFVAILCKATQTLNPHEPTRSNLDVNADDSEDLASSIERFNIIDTALISNKLREELAQYMPKMARYYMQVSAYLSYLKQTLFANLQQFFSSPQQLTQERLKQNTHGMNEIITANLASLEKISEELAQFTSEISIALANLAPIANTLKTQAALQQHLRDIPSLNSQNAMLCENLRDYQRDWTSLTICVASFSQTTENSTVALYAENYKKIGACEAKYSQLLKRLPTNISAHLHEQEHLHIEAELQSILPDYQLLITASKALIIQTEASLAKSPSSDKALLLILMKMDIDLREKNYEAIKKCLAHITLVKSRLDTIKQEHKAKAQKSHILGSNQNFYPSHEKQKTLIAINPSEAVTPENMDKENRPH